MTVAPRQRKKITRKRFCPWWYLCHYFVSKISMKKWNRDVVAHCLHAASLAETINHSLNEVMDERLTCALNNWMADFLIYIQAVTDANELTNWFSRWFICWLKFYCRPWIHVCIVSGFPNKVVALQFEWQWQNADKSRVMKKRKSVERSKRRGYQVSLKVLHSLLDSQLWIRLHLRVHFLDKEIMRVFSSYFACDDSGNSMEGIGNGDSKSNAELNTPAEFEAIHENRCIGDRGECTLILIPLFLFCPICVRRTSSSISYEVEDRLVPSP